MVTINAWWLLMVAVDTSAMVKNSTQWRELARQYSCDAQNYVRRGPRAV